MLLLVAKSFPPLLAMAKAVVSGMVLLTRQEEDGDVEVTVLSGDDGRPVAGAEVSLYQFDWQQGHHKVDAEKSGVDGAVRFASGPGLRNKSFFTLARKGDDLSLDTTYLSFYERTPPSETVATLFYTDRSIYRPGQKLYWKADKKAVGAMAVWSDMEKYLYLPRLKDRLVFEQAMQQPGRERRPATGDRGTSRTSS